MDHRDVEWLGETVRATGIQKNLAAIENLERDANTCYTAYLPLRCGSRKSPLAAFLQAVRRH